jgi:hypothetical protein
MDDEHGSTPVESCCEIIDEVEMRLFAVLFAVCALSSPALAQNCTGAPDVDGRLACRDNYAPAEKSRITKPYTPEPPKASAAKADPKTYIDEISAEDARMQAQLKNICRGC